MTSSSTFDTASSARLSGLSQIVAIRHCWRSPSSFAGKQRVIYASPSSFNLTGSIKDRMALHILKEAYRSGQLHPGDTIAEATSGNTGISFAAIGRALGHPVKIFMPDWMSRERKDLIASYGAEIVPVSHEQGGFLGSIHLAEEFKASHRDVFCPRQFSNEANAEAHETTTGQRFGCNWKLPDACPTLSSRSWHWRYGDGVGRFLRARMPGSASIR